MKELSIEQKAQRYDEAVEKLRNFYRDYDTVSCLIDVKEELANLFTELKEGEDERIRLKLIEAVKGDMVVGGTKDKQLAVAWLEKQGEQKLYVNDNAKEMFIKALERVEEQNAKGYKLTDCDKNSWWEDFKEYTTSEQILANSCKTCKEEQKPAEKQDKHDMGISEATKQKLEDNLNKALEKETPASLSEFLDEQKPADIDLRSIVDKEANAIWKEINTGGSHSIIDSFNQFYGICMQIAEAVVGSKNPAWTEEDEKILNLIIARLHSHSNVEAEEYGKDYYWLKSLKGRVQPQPKQKWSERDKEEFQIAIDTLVEAGQHDSANWLKSLKGRYAWRPSDEQVKALNYVTNLMASSESPAENDYYYNVFKDLREQLKKLNG